MGKIKENITHKKPKEIYAELRIDDSMNCARDFRVIKNLKYQQKQNLQNNVGMDKAYGDTVINKIFGEDGITDANCTIDFETRTEELQQSMEGKYPRFQTYFEKQLKTRLKHYVVDPCIVDSSKRNWTNNNAESLNNILKLAVDWKPQGARELIKKLHSVTELHFLDYRSSLHDDGNYRLSKDESHYRVTAKLWRCKTDAEKDEIFLRFLKDSKEQKRKYIESSDGKFSVIAKAQTKATKASQSKRPRNERAISKK